MKVCDAYKPSFTHSGSAVCLATRDRAVTTCGGQICRCNFYDPDEAELTERVVFETKPVRYPFEGEWFRPVDKLPEVSEDVGHSEQVIFVTDDTRVHCGIYSELGWATRHGCYRTRNVIWWTYLPKVPDSSN